MKQGCTLSLTNKYIYWIKLFFQVKTSKNYYSLRNAFITYHDRTRRRARACSIRNRVFFPDSKRAAGTVGVTTTLATITGLFHGEK